MRFKLLLSALVLSSTLAFGNDGGTAAIKVSEIKMREYGVKNNERVILKRISNPNFEIIVKGSEAKKLQLILPSTVSVLTAMQPELKKDYDESFKALGIFSRKSAGASSKVINISCVDADMVTVGEKVKIVKRSAEETVCTISINGVGPDMDPADEFGDMQPFEPKACKE